MIMECLRQSYMIFLAKLKKHHFSPGPESSACQLFPLDDIPFNSLSFSSMVVTLSLVWFRIRYLNMLALGFILSPTHTVTCYLSWSQYVEDIKAGKLKFHYGTINKRYFLPTCRLFSLNIMYCLVWGQEIILDVKVIVFSVRTDICKLGWPHTSQLVWLGWLLVS